MNNSIIDVHHHIIPDLYRKALADYSVAFSGGKKIDAWTPERSLKHMEALGVQTAVMSISEPALYPIVYQCPQKARKLARQLNEYMADLINHYPGRFQAFAVLPMPDVEGSIEEARYALGELGFCGIGLLSNYGPSYLGDTVFAPFFHSMEAYQASLKEPQPFTIYVHPSVPPEPQILPRPEFLPLDYLLEFCFNTTRAAMNLILSQTTRRCPNERFLFSHMGGAAPYLGWRVNHCFTSALTGSRPPLMEKHVWESWKGLNSSKISKNQEVLEELGRFYYDTALAAHQSAYFSTEDLASGHTLFGSDSFYASQEKGEEFVCSLSAFLTEEEKEAVFYKNALSLFPNLLK